MRGRDDVVEAEAILDGFNRGPLAPASVERALISLGLGDAEAALACLEEAMRLASRRR
jgi:hypothetical protein